jgi:hypothetical protein
VTVHIFEFMFNKFNVHKTCTLPTFVINYIKICSACSVSNALYELYQDLLVSVRSLYEFSSFCGLEVRLLQTQINAFISFHLIHPVLNFYGRKSAKVLNLFIKFNCIFNDAVRSSDYLASNDRIINE